MNAEIMDFLSAPFSCDRLNLPDHGFDIFKKISVDIRYL